MSELAGVLVVLCGMVWLGLAGYAFAKMAEGSETKDGVYYFWFCIFLAPMMAAASFFAPPNPKSTTSKANTETTK